MRAKLVPLVLCTMGVVVLFFAGCRKQSEEVVPPSAPESYMNDKEFMGKLESARKERQSLAATRMRLAKDLEKRVEAVRAAKPGADDAALKAALESDPEFISLKKRIADLTAAIEENRLRATKFVGKRIAPARSGRNSAVPPAKEISK